MGLNEYVWLGHDNHVNVILKEDGSAVDTSGLTKITITLNSTTYSSTNQANDPIRWNQGGYDTGEIRIDLGGETIPVGRYRAYIVVYDATNTDGIVWSDLTIRVKAEVESS
jgi:hypothetical protein